MSNEIKFQPDKIDKGIADLHSSAEELKTTFAKEIEGENELDMVTAFNEIKRDYDELLSQFKALFLNNVQAANEAVENFLEKEKEVAEAIEMTD
ncbi:YwqI/YxiC family protein [Lentibacillus sp. Marseille-P4043]|uniref:YwqI/YxiC family protein n=1 Tax=Lentibacillus sp. Marseille-P4043 TaxID=2040293 RepID=UPI000D0AEDB1|nr:YwqI/YxiC family protein [Lentibacillus sp. Marseille-P4043]